MIEKLKEFICSKKMQYQSMVAITSLLATTFFGYVITVYAAQSLGAGGLGIYFLFLTYYGLFDLVGDSGFGSAVVKRISEGEDQNEYYTAYAILRFVLFLISTIFFITVSQYLVGLQENPLLLSLLIVALAVCTLASVIESNLYGMEQISEIYTGSIANTFARTLIQVVAILVGFGVGGMVVGIIVGLGVGLCVHINFAKLHLVKCKLHHFTGLFAFSFWSFLSASGFLIFTYTDTLLVAFFMSASDVGIYRIAFQLASIASLSIVVVNMILFPKISKWYTEQNHSMIESTLELAFTYSLFLTIPVVAGGVVLAAPILQYLYGVAFIPGTLTAIILLFSQLANIFMAIQVTCLNSVDKPRTAFFVVAVFVLINAILDILLIPLYGIDGAAIATLITTGISAFCAYLLLKSTVHVGVDKKTLVCLLISGLTMVGFILLVRYFIPITDLVGLISLIIAAGFIYLGTAVSITKPIRVELSEFLHTYLYCK